MCYKRLNYTICFNENSEKNTIDENRIAFQNVVGQLRVLIEDRIKAPLAFDPSNGYERITKFSITSPKCLYTQTYNRCIKTRMIKTATGDKSRWNPLPLNSHFIFLNEYYNLNLKIPNSISRNINRSVEVKSKPILDYDQKIVSNWCDSSSDENEPLDIDVRKEYRIQYNTENTIEDVSEFEQPKITAADLPNTTIVTSDHEP